MNTPVWMTVKLPDDEMVRHRIGPLTIFFKKIFNDIWITSSRDESLTGEPAELPAETDWIRTALPEEFRDFELTPVFPDRPVVVNSEFAYRVIKGARSRVYCRIPVFVRITPLNMPELIVAEIPTIILSNTWFGIFTEGELAYALSSTARRVLQKELFEPHLVVCPIEIQNQSDQELRFEKICLRVDRLSIYIKAHEMWADQTLITHHGKEGYSDIEMKGSIPVEAKKGGKLLTRPRTPIKKSFTVRTFKLLREINVPGI
ncbi:MAG: hypothetical protein WD097_02255 [Balneolales bacterium]